MKQKDKVDSAVNASDSSKDSQPRQVDFAAVDAPLREVSRLGALIGEVLVDQDGPELLARVEAVRKLAIARRLRGVRAGRN